MPTTIDNIGPENYARWAQVQEKLDRTLLPESKLVSPQAATEVTSPSFASEFNELLGLNRLHPSWAGFTEPAGFTEVKKSIFTSLLLPFMGPSEVRDALLERINQTKFSEEGMESLTPGEAWERKLAEQETEKGKQALKALFACIAPLDRDIIDANNGKTQFQKG